jgi:HSP20 family protein
MNDKKKNEPANPIGSVPSVYDWFSCMRDGILKEFDNSFNIIKYSHYADPLGTWLGDLPGTCKVITNTGTNTSGTHDILAAPAATNIGDTNLFKDFTFTYPPYLPSAVPSGDLIKGSDREYPRVNLSEDNDYYYIEAAVPGWKKEELQISIVNNILTLRGRKTEETKRQYENRKYIERAIATRNFERCFSLPKVDVENIESSFDNGLLYISLPKVNPEEPKRIDIIIK